MSFDFPNNPYENQEFVPPGSDVRYIYHAPIWVATGGGAAAGTPEAPTDGKQYGRQSAAWTEILVNPTWTTLAGKPATFPPTVPIASSDVTGLDAKQSSQDTLIGQKLDSVTYTPADILNKIKTVDGSASGLDADFLDGQDGSYYLAWGNFTGKPSTFPPTLPIAQSGVTNLVADLSAKEPSIALGTTDQFWRGDKTWQSVPVPDWNTLAGKPITFPPTLPIPTSGVTNLDNDQAVQDAAIASKENAIALGTVGDYWRGDKSWQPLNRIAVGLPNVDNTSDIDKPISLATQTALNGKENTANKGAANGYASLDVNAKVPASQLPAYVDDVLEFANFASFPATGQMGTIYVALDTNKTYRWSGSAYIEISPSPGSTDAVPEGTNNLYFTTARAAAAAPVQSVSGRTGAVTLTKSDVGLSNVDNTSDANKPISSATQTALNLKLDSASYTAADVLTKIKTVDGATSGLDADVLDGQDGTYYLALANATGTLPAARFDDTSHGNRSGGTLHSAVTISVNGFMLATDKVKLDGVQAGATDDLTATEILTALKTVDGMTSGLDADLVDGQDGAYYLAWANFTGKPSTFPPSAHTHTESEITNLVTDLAAKEPTIAAGSAGQYWRGDKTWQVHDKTSVGLPNVDNTSDLNKPVSTATQTALNGKENTIASGTTAQYWRGDKSWATLDKIAVGLANVDNTSDVNKPVSSATQTALNLKENTANKGVVNGYAGLDGTGRVPAAQLPAYVDDVLEFANLAGFPGTGTTGVIYVALDTNRTYRWSGSAYVEISPSPGSTDAVPEGATNLYFTNARASAAAPVQMVAGRTGAVVLTKTDVGLANVDNTTDLSKPVSTATQTALNGKENTITAGLNTQYWRGDKTWQVLDKTAAGLANVDNTSDANKPVSSATQTALNGKENNIAPGVVSQYWRGDKTWQTFPSGANAIVGISDTAPPNPEVGQFWWESDSGNLFIWYDDGDTKQWVQVNFGTIGAAGPANQLTVGTVTTGVPGSAANVTITGASPTQTINMAIPRGDTGAPNVLSIGTTTTIPPGGQATSSITGASPTQVLSLGIPRGDVGPANVLNIGTVDTTAPGGAATATITGTTPAQTLNLSIPQGIQGPQGLPGDLSQSTADTLYVKKPGDTMTGHLLPSSTSVNLGSATNRWGTVYTSDLSLKNEHGDWTIVEGSDDLFITNNRTGKRYKFILAEVD